MVDVTSLQLSPEDQAALIAAFQAENDKYLDWKRAAEEKRQVEQRIREKYINQAESRQRG